MTDRRRWIAFMALPALVAACGDPNHGFKGVGWGGGVQVTARPGSIDPTQVVRAQLCVETACGDAPTNGIGTRDDNPTPLPFTFPLGQVQGRKGEPLIGKELHVRVTLYAADGAQVATGSTKATAVWVDPYGWFCDRLGRDRGPALAVEFRSSSVLHAVRASSPPACRNTSTSGS